MRDAPGPRARQYRCQMRGFGRRQLCRRMMEVGLRRRLDTVDAGTEFGDVEIDLENALLRPQCFDQDRVAGFDAFAKITAARRSEEHTSELQSLMRISYAVFCMKKKTTKTNTNAA